MMCIWTVDCSPFLSTLLDLLRGESSPGQRERQTTRTLPPLLSVTHGSTHCAAGSDGVLLTPASSAPSSSWCRLGWSRTEDASKSTTAGALQGPNQDGVGHACENIAGHKGRLG